MISPQMNLFKSIAFAAASFLLFGCAANKPSGTTHSNLSRALTFYASFDRGTEADFAVGDARLYHAPSMAKQAEAKEGLPPTGEMSALQAQGVSGHALRFNKKKAPVIFYQAAKNVDYKSNNWNGTVSFWLSLDPQKDLEPGFTDPIQITPRAWNDAAFFVEFGKDENPRHFRLGVYADHKVWNPEGREWGAIPFKDKPLISVERPPFGRDKWTHIVFTWENFNSGQSNGVAKLYLDGKLQGAMEQKNQTFTWDPNKTLIMLGLSYIGLFDELSIYNRVLTEKEIAIVQRGVRTLVTP